MSLTNATSLAHFSSKMRAGSVKHWSVTDDGRQDPREPFLEFGSSHIENVTMLIIVRSLLEWILVCFFQASRRYKTD